MYKEIIVKVTILLVLAAICMVPGCRVRDKLRLFAERFDVHVGVDYEGPDGNEHEVWSYHDVEELVITTRNENNSVQPFASGPASVIYGVARDYGGTEG